VNNFTGNFLHAEALCEKNRARQGRPKSESYETEDQLNLGMRWMFRNQRGESSASGRFPFHAHRRLQNSFTPVEFLIVTNIQNKKQ
jgi:hypothetical protein